MRNATRDFSSPFPAFELSAEEKERLSKLAELLVQNTIAEYESHVYNDARIVDHDYWRFMKRKQKVRVYLGRGEKEIMKRKYCAMIKKKRKAIDNNAHMDFLEESASSWSRTAGASEATTTATRRPPGAVKLQPNFDLPTFLVAGTLEGTLDDAMYGATASTVDEMRIKTSYVHDNVVDAAILARLIEPSPESPFRSLCVKWGEKGQHPPWLQAFFKNRDAVVLEVTGITSLANGDRVGYLLMQSVHFPQTEPLASRIRSSLSMCTVFHEDSSAGGTVAVFAKVSMNPMSGVMRSLVVRSTVEALLSMERFVRCARMKKLAWALRQQHSCSIAHIPDECHGSARSNDEEPRACAQCKTMLLSSSFAWFTRRTQTREASFLHCKLCFQPLCHKCIVKEKLSCIPVDDELQRLTRREITFCALCIHVAVVRTQSSVVASEEAESSQRNTEGHKSLITAWLRGMLDQPLFASNSQSSFAARW
ncbi:hypothetical protein FI667_g15051, partial [Globisporangium splendens]